MTSNVIKLLKGYALYAFIGGICFLLPICYEAGKAAPLSLNSVVDAFFMSVSSMTTTGLVAFPISNFNFLGQVVCLILVQLGGIGYMTLTTFLYEYTKHRFDKKHEDMMNTSFAVPEKMDMKKFVKRVIQYTFVVELIGAILLFPVFLSTTNPEIALHYGNIPVWLHAVWSSIFHSISGFCTAGFSLYDFNLAAYTNNIWFNIVTNVICILGALGFIVGNDIILLIKGERKKLGYTSRVIVVFMLCAITLSTIIIQLIQPNLSWYESLFNATSAMTTTGFNTAVMSVYTQGSLLILMVLMFIGAAPSSTGGGVKITSITAAFAGIYGILFETDSLWQHKRVPAYRIRSAYVNICLYSFVLLIGILVVFIAESNHILQNKDFDSIWLVFESFSAIGTVGLSKGGVLASLTELLTPVSKISLTLMMFIGRVGVKSLFVFLLLPFYQREKKLRHRCKEVDMAVS